MSRLRVSAKYVICLVLILTAGTAACAGVTDRKDKETGVVMHIITDTPGFNTTGYPTCRTWSRDGKSIFVESSRPRPDGTSVPNERQLLQVDIADGKVTHLATLEVENTEKYGPAHLRVSTQYHADYSPETNTLVYYDMTGHNMYLLDLDTGKRNRILHEPEGTIGDPPSISTDGTRVVYYVMFPSVENRFFLDKTSVIFALDVHPETLQPKGEPRIIEAYPGRKGPTHAENPRDTVFVNHCQIDPSNKDHVSFAHEFGGVGTDGSIAKTRLWHSMVDETEKGYLDRQKVGEGHTHEVFSADGKRLYFVTGGGVSAIDFETGKKIRIFDAPEYRPCHVTVSPDERWVACDMWLDGEADEHGNLNSGLLLVDTKTGEKHVLCRFARGKSHPAHPHPNFSPDGTKIAFTLADGPNYQVAWVEIGE